MDADFLLGTLDSEGNSLAAAAATGLDRPVAACPGWDVRAVVDHVANVYRWAAAFVRTREQQELTPGEPADDPVPDFKRGLAELEGELRSASPESEMWTLASDRGHLGWWMRRWALETAVHRWDVEAAVSSPGSARPVATPLAVEGIDEFLTDMLPRALRRGAPGVEGTLHLHCTDADGEWLIDLSAEHPAPTREHAKADTAIRGPAGGLYLWLWNRLAPDAAGLETFGHASVVEAWTGVRI